MTLSETTLDLLDFINNNPEPGILELKTISPYYQRFIDTLIEHNHRYYIQSSPIISDLEYDQLFAYLKKIEEAFPQFISSNSPTQVLIGQIADGFSKADHKIPLLSLENSYNAEDLLTRDQRWKKILEKSDFSAHFYYNIEPKFDGLSVEIIYQNGKLTQAITRGDGKTGEDITTNIKTIKSLPHQLSENLNLRIRGEIMMPKSMLKSLNTLRETQGLNLFANTRNAASGSIKLLDSAEVAKRGLICFVYDILEGDQTLELAKLGLPTFRLPAKYETHSKIETVIATCEDIELKTYLDQQDFDIDGLVVKLCNQTKKEEQNLNLSLFGPTNSESKSGDIRNILGNTEHHPRRAIAYKYPAQQVASKILSIDFQVGRTGIITPVANLQPVSLSGATISRVSLHNFDFIQQKQIKNGDFVRIQRSGEVIPYVLGPIIPRRDGTEDFITPPLLCPSCQSPISNIDIHYYCTNPSCPAQLKEKILYFVSRDALDITGFGDAIVQILVDQHLVKSVADLYNLLSIEMQVILRKFPNFGEKKISELTSQLEQSKKQPLRRLLNAVGIPNIGKKTAQDLAYYLSEKKVKNLTQLIENLQNTDQLAQIYGVGEKVAEGIRLFCDSPANIQILKQLENHGLNFSSHEEKKNDSSAQSFSITGTFPIARSEIIDQLVAQGYQYDENPLQTTNIMLIGEKSGSKAEKARKYGLTIFDQRETICQTFALKCEEKPIQNNKKQSPIQGGLF